MTQLLVTVEDASALSNLRIAIRQMRGVASVSTLRKNHRQVLELAEGKNHKVMQLRLHELQSLKDGWDGNESKAISPVCVKAMEDILEVVPDKLLKNWALFPDSRGYLYLDYTFQTDVAGITLMPQGFAYFIKKDSLVEKSCHTSLSSTEVLQIMTKVYGT